MDRHSKFGRPKTVVFFLDRLNNYKSPSKPRCTVYIHLGQAKKKLAKTHVTSDYSWETEVPVTLPTDVTDDATLTLRVMDNKKEVGSTSVQLYCLPYGTQHRTGRKAFPSIPHKLDEPLRRNQKPANGGVAFALLYSCWIRDVNGESIDTTLPGESKPSRSWKPLRRLRKAFSRSNLVAKDGDSSLGELGVGNGTLQKKKCTKSMYDLTAVASSAESEMLRANGMLFRPVNLDEHCPPPSTQRLRNATSLHNLAMSPNDEAEEILAWVHDEVPCPPDPVDGKEVEEPIIIDVEPRYAVWGEESVHSILGDNLGNAGRDIERLTVCGIDVTDSCYSDPPSTVSPRDHVMFHVFDKPAHLDLPMPSPDSPLRRGHVEILYKNGHRVKSVQRVTLLPPDTVDLRTTGHSVADAAGGAEQGFQAGRRAELEEADNSSDLSEYHDAAQPFDLDNFHPSSGVLQAARAMMAAGQLEAEPRHGAPGEQVVVKPRIGSFNGEEATATRRPVCHVKNSSMPHLGQCCAPEGEAEAAVSADAAAAEEEGEVKRRRDRPDGVRKVVSATESLKKKTRRGSDKSLSRGLGLPRFSSRTRLDLLEGSGDLGLAGGCGEAGEEGEEVSVADSAYDTLRKMMRSRAWGKRKSHSVSSSVTSADLVEENQRLKLERQNLKDDVEELWSVNRKQKHEIVHLQRKLHELTDAFERHKNEADSHRNELMNLKSRLLIDQLDHYLCIDA